MDTIQLNRRLTHRYVGTYAHEDNWQDVGTARLTPPRAVAEGNGIDDGGVYVRWAVIPAGQDAEARAAMLRGSTQRSSSEVTSAKTGVAPRRTAALAVATKVSAGSTTSSPGPTPAAR